jgi:HlyD family secretion protein
MTDVSNIPRAPKRSRKKLIFFIVLLFVAAGGITAAVISKKRVKPIPISTEKAEQRNITQLVTATGKIQPEVLVNISPEVSGEIIELPVKEGQVIHKGELLLRIKPDTYRAQVEEQEAALSGARSASEEKRTQLEKTKVDYERAQNLFRQRLLPESDRKAAQTNYEAAQAVLQSSVYDIQRAEGALRQIRESLSKTTIVAPSSGAITTLNSRLGERVVGTSQFAGTNVMSIADLSVMEAQVNVNENDVINVKVGDHARISVDAYPDRKINGTVREIASTATTQNAGTQEEVTNFLVKIKVDDHDVRLRPGMSTTADIETDTVANAVAVPIQAVTVRATDQTLSPEEMEKQGSQKAAQEKSGNDTNVTNEQQEKQKARAAKEKLMRVVYVRDGNKVHQRRVETGIADNTYIEIKNGIKPGEEVVSGSYTAVSRRLKDGAVVEIEKNKTLVVSG